MKIFGYARVSTNDQSLDSQLDQLTDFGCHEIVCEKESGRKSRKQLHTLFQTMNSGDTLVVTKLDRLSRSTRDLLELTDSLQSSEINLISLKEKIDTTSPMGKFYFTLMAALAEMEVSVIRERTKMGLAAARKRGNFGGRPPLDSDTQEEIKRLAKTGMPKSSIATKMGVGESTVYKYLRK
ncbi:recombinase family protein [Listeria booriae]|uniref:recombinase family protein n=1 Tax=Listeria booriae TaxID=1552123 RepID=UPI001628E5F7|nr:recombinase family protein [Listeria booriae]MBC1576097.1 recombinase family protein [Listeria booriae]MBC2058071.1 recombinase family protein [Listeria booriae]MBC2069391.1 recombinase family protein [Listeria booriae]MBC2106644.1 recombinase family protein [Listeria booriae]